MPYATGNIGVNFPSLVYEVSSRSALFILCVKGRHFPGVGEAGASSDLDTLALCQVFTQLIMVSQVLFSEARLGSQVGEGTVFAPLS